MKRAVAKAELEECRRQIAAARMNGVRTEWRDGVMYRVITLPAAAPDRARRTPVWPYLPRSNLVDVLS